MNIFINTLGSRGDVQPYVALGQGLQAAGHKVTICTAARFEQFITDHGLAYGFMNDEVLALVDSEEMREIMGNTTNAWGAMQATMKLSGRVGPLQRMMIDDSWVAAQAANPDLIIFHPKAYGGPHFAEKLGVPAILAPTLPQFIPTAEFPAIGFPDLGLGGWYNRMTYSLTTRLTVLGVGGHTNRWRKANGLPAQMRGTNFLLKMKGVPLPVLHPLSAHVLRVPTDWPRTTHASGYWFLPTRTDWQPTPALQSFLAAGEAPVYVGFGSMVGTNPRQLTQTIIAALQQAGVRGILATGWGGLEADDLPQTLFKLDEAPHEWLFPQMAAIVHHGGAGTTAASVAAGKPTLISPYFGDQPFWGKRIHALGVGPQPIPQKKLTVENLADAIRRAVTDPTMRQKAEALGEEVRNEQGVARAISIIEAIVRKTPALAQEI